MLGIKDSALDGSGAVGNQPACTKGGIGGNRRNALQIGKTKTKQKQNGFNFGSYWVQGGLWKD